MIFVKSAYDKYSMPASLAGSLLVNLILFIILGFILATATIDAPGDTSLVLTGIKYSQPPGDIPRDVPEVPRSPQTRPRPVTEKKDPKTAQAPKLVSPSSKPPSENPTLPKETIQKNIPVINIPDASSFKISQRDVSKTSFAAAPRSDLNAPAEFDTEKAGLPEGSVKISIDEMELSAPEINLSQENENLNMDALRSDISLENYSVESYEMPQISKGTGVTGTAVRERKVIKAFLPDAPEWVEKRGIMPSVICDLKINPAGQVTNISFKQRSGYAEFDAFIVENLRKWEFEPANHYSVKTVKLKVKLLK